MEQFLWAWMKFKTGKLYSKSFRFTDINYYIADKEQKKDIERSILLRMKEDGLDHYREEYNEMLHSKISEINNSIIRERYLTISVFKKSIDEARTFFSRVGTEVMSHLAKLSSIGEELDAGEKLFRSARGVQVLKKKDFCFR